MLATELAAFFERDLNKLIEEIQLYPHESDLWVINNGIANSAGNLCLHIIGNLNHFVGATLGNTGYIRQRDLEFSSRDIPREKIIADLKNTIDIVKKAIADLPEPAMADEFPLEKHGGRVSNMHMLIHLFGHLSYHLGQVNYHRRLLEG